MVRLQFRILLALGLLVQTVCSHAQAEQPKSLRHAHAHNDYRHKRPLLDAMDHGFNSVEADIFLVDGKLLVGHEKYELRLERTLERLYLEPLAKRIEKNGGYVQEPEAPFYLFIDIKQNADAAREVLGKLLLDYKSIVGRRADDDAPTPAVTVVLSGSEPRRGIEVDGLWLAGADGRLSDLDSELPAVAMPVISDHWMQHFGWLGINELPDDQLQRLREVTKKAHESGRIVRFWATLDSEHLWDTLLDNGVDLINTDDLPRLSEFLKVRDSDSEQGSAENSSGK